jgi:hypothetical protein
MSNPIRNLTSYLASPKFKMHALDTKLTIRKTLFNINQLAVTHHFKKFYLVFFIAACLIPLYTLQPLASSEDSKFIKLTNQLQVDSKNTNSEYSDLTLYTPNLSEVKSSYFVTYKLQQGDSLDKIQARFSNISKTSLEVNNANREWKEGIDILVPTSNGLLIGFNKDTNLEEYAQATGQPLDVIKGSKGSQAEGYFFFPTQTPSEFKKSFDENIKKLRQPKIIIQNSNGSVSRPSYQTYNVPSGNLASQFQDFVSRTRGISQHDGNGWSPGQCVSLVKQWQIYLGARSGYWPGNYPAPSYYAYLNGNKSMAPDVPSFRIVIVTDVNSLSAGDILITTGYPSHTGIATGRNSGGTFDIYDQNSPFGSAPRFNTYPNRMFIGALRYIRN